MGLAGFACRVFYRQARLGGTVPAEGPLILVGNHPNGLIDPVFLAGTTDRTVRFLGKAPLFEMPILGSLLRGVQALPVYRAIDGADTADNERTFEAVYAALRSGDVICLFPEGLSHSEPSLERLKTGAARMALGAERSAGYELGVRIVPVGLVFRHKGRFRSKAATWVGEPIPAADQAELHRRDDRAAVTALTERIAKGIRSVTPNLDRWEDLPLLELAERIWRPDEGRRVERLQRLAAGVRHLRREHPVDLRELGSDLSAFATRLEQLGLQPHDLALRYTPARVLSFAARNLFALVLGLPLAFLGTILWWLPYRVSLPLGKLWKPVPETLATTVVMAALVVFPIWFVVLVAAAWLFAGPLAGLVVALLAPGLGLIAVGYWEGRRQAFADLSVFFRLGLRSRLKALLIRQRDALAARIEALSAELEANSR